MNCSDFQSLLDEYRAGRLDTPQAEQMAHHLQACEQCRLAWQVLEDCRTLNEDAVVPERFASNWRQLIQQEEGIPVQTHKPTHSPLRWLAVAAALVLVVGGTVLTGGKLGVQKPAQPPMQSQQYSGGAPAPQADAALGSAYQSAYTDQSATRGDTKMMEAAPEAANYAAAPQEKEKTAEKIIRTVRITLSTRTFDDDLQRIYQLLDQQGGRIEYSDVATDMRSPRHASLTLRVPAQQLDAFVTAAKDVGYAVSFSESAEDVSEQYSDTALKLATQKTKMERLQALLQKAGSVEDLLNIENQIAQTQYELDSLTGALKGLDSKVDYATVNIDLREEVFTAPENVKSPALGERVGRAVQDAWARAKIFLADMVVFLAVIAPYLLAVAAAIAILVVLIKHRRKKG